MPILSQLAQNDKKKIDITAFLKDLLQENETAFLTVKKIPYSVKSKIKLMGLTGVKGKIAKLTLDRMKKAENEKRTITKEEMASVMNDLTEEEVLKMGECAYEIDITRFLNGIDLNDHNFYSKENEKIILNEDFFDQIILPREKLKDFILNEIELFNGSIAPGE